MFSEVSASAGHAFQDGDPLEPGNPLVLDKPEG